MTVFLFDLAAQVLLMLTAALLLTVAYRNDHTCNQLGSQVATSASTTQHGWLDERGVAVAVTTATGLIFYLVHLSLIVAVPSLAAIFVITKGWLTRRRLKIFRKSFDHCLPELMDTIASSLKAGLTLKDALRVSSENSIPQVQFEISKVLRQYRLGLPLEEALDSLRQRIGTPSAIISFGALMIGHQLGGAVPEILKKIVATIRERERVEGRLEALTAQGKAQAFILCGAPILIFIGLYLFEPSKTAMLIHTDKGQMLMALAVILELIGIYATSRILRLEV